MTKKQIKRGRPVADISKAAQSIVDLKDEILPLVPLAMAILENGVKITNAMAALMPNPPAARSMAKSTNDPQATGLMSVCLVLGVITKEEFYNMQGLGWGNAHLVQWLISGKRPPIGGGKSAKGKKR